MKNKFDPDNDPDLMVDGKTVGEAPARPAWKVPARLNPDDPLSRQHPGLTEQMLENGSLPSRPEHTEPTADAPANNFPVADDFPASLKESLALAQLAQVQPAKTPADKREKSRFIRALGQYILRIQQGSPTVIVSAEAMAQHKMAFHTRPSSDQIRLLELAEKNLAVAELLKSHPPILL